MIKKQLAIRCNKCYNILTKTGECFCKKLAFIKIKNVFFVYTDDEDCSIVMVFIDSNGRKIKVIDLDILKKASVLLPVSKDILERIKPLNLVKKGNDANY